MATHSIAFASSLLSDAWRPHSTQYTHSAPFNPVAVRLESLFVPPHECGVCLRVAHRKGRRERLRARSWRASSRGDRDRNDGGQDAEGEGAERHRLDFCRGFSDGYAGDPSGLNGALCVYWVERGAPRIVQEAAGVGDGMRGHGELWRL